MPQPHAESAPHPGIALEFSGTLAPYHARENSADPHLWLVAVGDAPTIGSQVAVYADGLQAVITAENLAFLPGDMFEFTLRLPHASLIIKHLPDTRDPKTESGA